MRINRKSLKRSFSLFAITSLLSTSANYAGNISFNKFNPKKIVAQNIHLNYPEEFLNGDNLFQNQNYLLSSLISNPNLLEIEGPPVSLVF